MADVTWAKALEKLEEYIFKMLTPTGVGTGFLISLSGNICGIATAFHVVEHEYDWEEPIKIQHYRTGKQVLLRKPDRVIFPYSNQDLAFILFPQGEFELPTKMLKMKPSDKYVRQGVQMGWCGFPNIASSQLCFFTGHVSALLQSTGSYLVDGVAINGVSGGPAFTVHDESPHICGVVSAYIANRATGETLPGVCLIRDVAPYQDLLSRLESLEQAKETAKAETAEQEATKESRAQPQKAAPRNTLEKEARRTTPKNSAPNRKTAKKTAKIRNNTIAGTAY